MAVPHLTTEDRCDAAGAVCRARDRSGAALCELGYSFSIAAALMARDEALEAQARGVLQRMVLNQTTRMRQQHQNHAFRLGILTSESGREGDHVMCTRAPQFDVVINFSAAEHPKTRLNAHAERHQHAECLLPFSSRGCRVQPVTPTDGGTDFPRTKLTLRVQSDCRSCFAETHALSIRMP